MTQLDRNVRAALIANGWTDTNATKAVEDHGKAIAAGTPVSATLAPFYRASLAQLTRGR